MKKLNHNIGSCEYDGLIYQANPAADVFSVTLRGDSSAEEGKEKLLKRGTVLALSSKDEKFVILGTNAGDSETLEANCILADDVPLGKDDVDVVAYRTGHFNRDALIVADSYELKAADEEALRKGGILLSTAL